MGIHGLQKILIKVPHTITCGLCFKKRPNSDFQIIQGKWIYRRCKACRRLLNRRWRAAHPDKVDLYHQRSYRRSRTKIRGYITVLLSQSRNRSKRMNLKECNLDLNYLCDLFKRQKGVCAISGTRMLFGKAKGRGHAHDKTVSLDRIKPELGYVKGNVRFVTLWANVMRYQKSDNQLLDMCRLIVRHLKVRG